MRFSLKTDNRVDNLAGGHAFKLSPEYELTFAVLTTFLTNKFYETGGDRLDRIVNLVRKCNPLFVAKLASFTRNQFYMRSSTTVLLGELSKNHRGDSLVMTAIMAATPRVDDLIELVSYLKGKLPKQVKRGIRHSLMKFNPYQLAKYRGEGHETKLVDVFNLVHPNPKFATPEQKEAWKQLMTGELKSRETWEARLSSGENKQAAWSDLILGKKLGYMALLRNLNNIIKADLNPFLINEAANQLTDPEAIYASKQLPFRFYTAYKKVTGNRRLTDAISEAMDIALDNVPVFDGSLLIALDSSGSMSSCMDKAAPFAAALFKANKNADFILYDTRVEDLTNTSSRMPVVDIIQKIEKENMGGGTMTSLVFNYAAKLKKVYDRIIIISDQESWAERSYWSGSDVNAAYNAYKVIADPFVYAIDIQGYDTSDVAGGKVFRIAGWSDKLLEMMKYLEQGESILDQINSVEL